ncbi:MAG: hypothetical protein FWH40_02540 [Coriobacteriia bacterium]|nr:hypothetical protein [Coriobacteriia bacterium]
MSIVSEEQTVEALSNALAEASQHIGSAVLGTETLSSFSVESGYLKVTKDAMGLDTYIHEIAEHLNKLLKGTADIFSSTDTAISTEILSNL